VLSSTEIAALKYGYPPPAADSGWDSDPETELWRISKRQGALGIICLCSIKRVREMCRVNICQTMVQRIISNIRQQRTGVFDLSHYVASRTWQGYRKAAYLRGTCSSGCQELFSLLADKRTLERHLHSHWPSWNGPPLSTTAAGGTSAQSSTPLSQHSRS
jgi:hypothetical protein